MPKGFDPATRVCADMQEVVCDNAEFELELVSDDPAEDNELIGMPRF